MKKFFSGKNKIPWIIIIGLLGLGLTAYFFPENGGQIIGNGEPIELPDQSLKLVTGIVDGDTFLIDHDVSVRILGIDAEERGYPCARPAKNRLEELILNKEVRLEKPESSTFSLSLEKGEGLDQYGRYLRHVFLDEQNIALQLIKEGLVESSFSSQNIKYQDEIIEAEREAKKDQIGCKWALLNENIEEQENNELLWERLIPAGLNQSVIEACQAKKYLGEEIIIQGQIIDTYHDSKTNTVFLSFGQPYPQQCFNGVIFNSHLYKFRPDLIDYYLNKTVRIKGQIKEYQDIPQIILESPEQIEIEK